MSKKASMASIAKELGISKNTVSLVFRNIPGINGQTRAKVLETADRLGYVYSRGNPPEGDTSGAAASICIVIPASARDNSGFFSHILFGIEGEARKNRINTVISYYDDSDEMVEIPLCIREGTVSGIITLGRIKRAMFDCLREYNLPLLIVDHYYEDLAWDYVLSDNFSGGYMAARYLISKGHTRIGFQGCVNLSVSFYDRFLGFKKALEQANLPFAEEFFINKSYEAMAVRNPVLVTEDLKKMPKFPSAFFCCNDIEAISLIKGLGAIGCNLPQDISVIGFDDIDLAKNFYPELTTIHVSNELLGIKALQGLLRIQQLKGQTKEKLVLGVSLVERQSVNPI